MREGFSQEPLVPLCRYKRAIEDRAKIGSCIEEKDRTNQFAFSAYLQLLTDRRGRHPPGDQAMKQLIYAMQFKGQGGPGASPNVLKAATSSPSATVTSVIGSEGLHGSVQSAAGGKASFESEVTITGETSF